MKYRSLYLCAMTLLVSCTADYDKEAHYYTTTEQLYGKNFMDLVGGTIDAQQTWIGATDKSVNVVTSVASEVMVFTSDGSQLLADYTDVMGSRTLTFTADFADSAFLVTDGAMAYTVAEGHTADFAASATRAGSYASEPVSVTQGEYLQFDYNAATAWSNTLPEGTDNLYKITQNFRFVSHGTFTLYPLYWNATAPLTVSLYWQDATGTLYTQEIYTTQSGDELQYSLADTQGTATDDSVQGAWSGPKPYPLAPADSAVTYSWSDVGAQTVSASPYLTGADYERARGIVIDLPEGTVFGLCMRDAYGHVFYTERDRNADPGRDEKGRLSTARACHAACFDYDGGTYLGFEDWDNSSNGADFDLNDLVFRFADTDASALPLPIDLDGIDSTTGANRYLFAFEDMTSTDDFDFNDVVLAVDYVCGQHEATVTLLAAGTSQQTSVQYDGSELFAEVHRAFGVETTTSVNTGRYTYSGTLPGITLDVPEDYSVVASAHGFSIVTTDTDEQTHTIALPAVSGSVPQCIVIRGGSWEWPAETQNITACYPQFADWAADHTQTSWSSAVWDDGTGRYVVSQKAVPALAVTLANTALAVGETQEVSVLSDSDGKVTITTSDSGVLRLEQDRIVGVAPGYAVVTVTVAATELYEERSVRVVVAVAAP